MSAIKFRAWAIEDKKFIDPNSVYVNGNGDLLSYGSRDDTGGFNQVVVIQQYTELKDKNGKEIYEGDILRNDWNHNIFVVEWGEGEYPHQSDADSTNNKWNWKYGGCEVIGNIYEHPSLLQEEKGNK